MKKRQLVGLCMTLVLLVCASCGDDSDPVVPPKIDPYKDLTLRDNVLHNLQMAYVNRNIDRYNLLLDDGFVFYFSATEFKEERVPIDHWDRAAEIAATQNIFDPNFADPQVRPISKINLTLRYPEGEDGWNPMTPADTIAYPGETWYEKTVRYDLIMTSGPIDYTGLSIQASFIVRRAEVNGKSIWRIVSWRDDTEYQLTRLRAGSAGLGSSEDTTWGRVKWLYGQGDARRME